MKTILIVTTLDWSKIYLIDLSHIKYMKQMLKVSRNDLHKH